jgi:hypothetical protein
MPTVYISAHKNLEENTVIGSTLIVLRDLGISLYCKLHIITSAKHDPEQYPLLPIWPRSNRPGLTCPQPTIRS